MADQTTNNAVALAYLLNDEIYQLHDSQESHIGQNSTQEATVPSYDYEGGNKRSILMIFNNPDAPHMDAADKEALLKILAAKKWTMDDIALFNLRDYPSAAFESLKTFFKCGSLILLGPAPTSIGLGNLAAHTILEQEEVKLLYTYSFADMHQDNDKKRTFWNEIKKL